MSLVVEGFRSDIVAVGELGDETVAQAAERIAGVFTRSAPGRIFDLLSLVVTELSDGLPEGRIEIRVVGDDVEFAYEAETHEAAESDAELSARITLRLPEALKARVEEKAAADGTSVNTWIVRALERMASAPAAAGRGGRGGRVGSRLHGYGTS
ncbi:MAG TPA: toxin-antitoxin system HicB family antitoxin [Acidimicrobiales bacterium]|nr:toxin-antitoxin system HicB family antitoxin [Acidimicrobiales bacterium]